MRILFLSNFYPPLRAGGYAQLSHEVAQRLEERGHQVGVVASRYKREEAPTNETGVFRLLHLEGDLFYYRPLKFFTEWQRNQQKNKKYLRTVIDSFKPDIIMIWGMWALSKTVAAVCERLLPSRVVYYLADYWPVSKDMHTSYWRQPAQHRIVRLPKKVLARLAMWLLAQEDRSELQFEHVLCVSAALRDTLVARGLPISHAKVVHNGIDVKQFLNGDDPPERNSASIDSMRLLYAGQVVAHKGVHTAIEAMAILAERTELGQISLTVVGAGHPHYESKLHTLVERSNLGDKVEFWGRVPREEMPAILQQFDVLVFPSTYEEPLARMVQEAMASGLIVVGTITGGTGEILVNGANGMTFAPEDAAGLAERIAKLAVNPELRVRLARAARQTVIERFTIDRTVQEVEAYLEMVVENS